jgi:acetyltransferase-like isoleucine patch superfamily enzyme
MSNPSDDFLTIVPRIINKLHSIWLSWTYPFAKIGSNFSAHYSCDLGRSIAKWIQIGNSVQIHRDVWINLAETPANDDPIIILGDGCKLGRRSMISAKNRIQLEGNILLAPGVLIMDHNHEFADVRLPIAEQGVTNGGTIRIEEGCWIGFGAAIVCSEGELVIGRNSVIGANAVVGRSVPPYSIISGNPGRVVKHYDITRHAWVLGSGNRGHEESADILARSNEDRMIAWRK